MCWRDIGGWRRASIVEALARNGAGEVVVVNRSAPAAVAAAALAGAVGRVGRPADAGVADIVVNATSVGMGTREVPLDPALLHDGQVVADIVYHPRRTALLEAAEIAGAATVDGLGMLVHQAALQQALWTGHRFDIAAMAARRRTGGASPPASRAEPVAIVRVAPPPTARAAPRRELVVGVPSLRSSVRAGAW